MKNIIPFKKEVIFKTNIDEITSIALEHSVSINKNNISGEFLISGDYKVTNTSHTTEPFDIKIPFDISIDERYDTDRAIADIDDFYYEIANNNVLSISIDLLVDKLEEKLIIEEDAIEPFSEVKKVEEILNIDDDESYREEETVMDIQERNETQDTKEIIKDKMDSLFNKFSEEETFVTYNISIIREGDNIESIIEKYGISEDLLKKYNNLTDLKKGDKLIIPSINETN